MCWPVWECGCGCFSKCFSCWNASKWCFFIFKKIFLRSVHQNDPKHTKKLIFSNKNWFFWNAGWPAFPNMLIDLPLYSVEMHWIILSLSSSYISYSNKKIHIHLSHHMTLFSSSNMGYYIFLLTKILHLNIQESFWSFLFIQ